MKKQRLFYTKKTGDDLLSKQFQYLSFVRQELVRKLDALEGLHWLRILYLYPDEIPDDLIQTIHDSRHVIPYFDIPVQSADDAEILRSALDFF